jgi:hypothetical protein
LAVKAIEEANKLEKIANTIPISDAVDNMPTWLAYVKSTTNKKAWSKLIANLSFSVATWSLDTLAETINLLQQEYNTACKLGIGKEASVFRTLQAKARFLRCFRLLQVQYQATLDRQADSTLASIDRLEASQMQLADTAKAIKSSKRTPKLDKTLGIDVASLLADDDDDDNADY